MKPSLRIFFIFSYIIGVSVCIWNAFDFEGAVNVDWTFALIAITLPWSIISIIFLWGLMHGAGLEFFAVLFLIFAGLNSLGFYLIVDWLSKNDRLRRLLYGNQKPDK